MAELYTNKQKIAKIMKEREYHLREIESNTIVSYKDEYFFRGYCAGLTWCTNSSHLTINAAPGNKVKTNTQIDKRIVQMATDAAQDVKMAKKIKEPFANLGFISALAWVKKWVNAK